MRALTLTALIRPDHTLIADIPNDIPAGTHQIVLILQEDSSRSACGTPFTANWPAHPVGLSDPNLTFRREDIYDDDGR